MHVSDKGRAFIGVQEGLRLRAYRDAVTIWTIGYGHTSMAGVPMVHPGMVITRVQADQILAHDLLKYEQEVLHTVHVPLSQCQFDALVSFTYNCGLGSLDELVSGAHLNAGKYGAVPGILMWFVHADGRILPDLMRRRRAEGAMFEGHYPWLPAMRLAIGARELLTRMMSAVRRSS